MYSAFLTKQKQPAKHAMLTYQYVPMWWGGCSSTIEDWIGHTTPKHTTYSVIKCSWQPSHSEPLDRTSSKTLLQSLAIPCGHFVEVSERCQQGVANKNHCLSPRITSEVLKFIAHISFSFISQTVYSCIFVPTPAAPGFVARHLWLWNFYTFNFNAHRCHDSSLASMFLSSQTVEVQYMGPVGSFANCTFKALCFTT